MVGLNCALRAGKEHHNLCSIQGQFAWMFDDNGTQYLRYHEDIGHKTNKGGIKSRKIEAKIVDIYGIPNSERCPLAIIGKYLSLLPTPRTCQAFYLQPLANYTPFCWYQDSPVGINKLQKVVKIICQKGGLPVYYTNHSLRATAATRLYHGQFDEQLIQEVTGHHSLAVCSYKRTCPEQRQNASKCINSTCFDDGEMYEPVRKAARLS